MDRKRITHMLNETRKLQGRLIRTLLFYAMRCLRINPRKLVFCVFSGNDYSDNPKYILEEILRQSLDYELVWLLSKENIDRHNLPSKVRPVRFDSLRAIFELATAGVWVDNHLKPVYVRKRKGQYYIQTSHGLPCLKRPEFENYIAWCKMEARKIDLYISNSSWTSSAIERDFHYKGEILKSGNPRNDRFFDTDKLVSERVRQRYGVGPHNRIVLYAPTWRPHYDLSEYTFDSDLCLKSLRQRFSGDWVLMVRHHPAVRGRSLGIMGISPIIDASDYEDVQELLVTVDAVVTDYSSLMFDFAIRRLPLFLYTPDIDAYGKERGLYFREGELPFPFARSNAQLAHEITKYDEAAYLKRVNDFFVNLATYDNGKASKAVVSTIQSHLARVQTMGNCFRVDGSSRNTLRFFR